MNHYQTNLPAQYLQSNDPKAQQLLERAMNEMGMIPNMFANMANLPAVLETYWHGYNQFRDSSGLTPVEQEVVFLTISRENECVYCVTGHSVAADYISQDSTETTNAIRDRTEIPDAKLKALSDFTLAMLRKRGLPDVNDMKAFHGQGYTDKDAMAVILAIGLKTISNYTNHLFNTQPDTIAMVTGRLWTPSK